MVDQMGLTEYSKFVAMQQTVKPVTGKLGDHYGIDECCDDSDKGTVETIRDHWGTPVACGRFLRSK